MERFTDEYGFNAPTREQLIKSAALILKLEEGDVVESVKVNGVEIQDYVPESAPLLVDDRIPSVSVRAVSGGLPGSNRRRY